MCLCECLYVKSKRTKQSFNAWLTFQYVHAQCSRSLRFSSPLHLNLSFYLPLSRPSRSLFITSLDSECVSVLFFFPIRLLCFRLMNGEHVRYLLIYELNYGSLSKIHIRLKSYTYIFHEPCSLPRTLIHCCSMHFSSITIEIQTHPYFVLTFIHLTRTHSLCLFDCKSNKKQCTQYIYTRTDHMECAHIVFSYIDVCLPARYTIKRTYILICMNL